MFVEWDENIGSSSPATFWFGSFDVRKAKRLLKANPHQEQPLDLAGYRALSKMVTGVNSSSQSIGLGVPLILVPVNGGLLPIDGWGRIAKALAQDVCSLDAVILSAREKQEIELGGVIVAPAHLRVMLNKHEIGDKEDAVIAILKEIGLRIVDS